MESAPELCFGIKPAFVPRRISDLLSDVSTIRDWSQRESRLNCFVDELEQEMKKIDAFKRELPLCMLLLSDGWHILNAISFPLLAPTMRDCERLSCVLCAAIVFLREEARQCTTSDDTTKPNLAEFMPRTRSFSMGKNESIGEDEIKAKEKKEWMSSVQLWHVNEKDSKTLETRKGRNEVSIQSSRNTNAATPGKQFRAHCRSRTRSPDPSLSLVTPGFHEEESTSLSSRSMGHGLISCALDPRTLSSRKQRRCWSSELHRRFVNALQQLGGCQVATPKQIRELMQVDGLTNDEVKSHLQKYRLHSRRGSSSSLVACRSQSGSPQGPFQLVRPGTSITGGDSDEDVKSDNCRETIASASVNSS